MTRSTRWLPNTFIAGAPKAGTSSVHQWIADHPDAAGSFDKETYFLVDPGTHMFRSDFHVSNGLEQWHSAFPNESSPPRVVIESTPAYLYSRTALEVIPDLPGPSRCVFLVREPGAQIYSLFTYFRDNWNWIPPDMTFAAFLDHARAGSHGFGGNDLAVGALANARYADFLVPWRDRLGDERMQVHTFDRLLADREGLVRDIAGWLGLDPAFYDDYPFPSGNETYTPRNRTLQKINVQVRKVLPKGRAYDAVRSAYRKLNTRKPAGKSEQDAALVAELGREYAEDNARLARAFDLDLAGWPLPVAAI